MHCYDNQLLNIDVSKNINLSSFWCHVNKLTSLNVSKNVNIKDLACNSNQISRLDLSLNKSITQVLCFENRLINLNLKNGENKNISLLMAKDNPDLACIQVDNVSSASGYKDWQKDVGASYSDNCSLFLSVPDIQNSNSVFKQCSIFPNPATDILNIELLISKEALLDITIKNMLGIVNIKKSMGEYIGESKLQLNTSDLPNGVYILELNLTTKNSKNKKLYKVVISR